MTFDNLVDKSMRLNFVYVDRNTNELLVSRILDVNASGIATLFYLQLGREINEDLMILNWCIGNCDFDEIKFLISKFSHRTGAEENYRQILLVEQPQIGNFDILFPNTNYRTIKMK